MRDLNITIKSIDCYKITDIARAADRGIRIIKSKLHEYPLEEVLQLLKDHEEAIQKLHETTNKICALTKTTYIQPKCLTIVEYKD